MRLDHLLSKEHHEKRPASSWGVSREGVGGCSGAHRVHNSNVLPDTLLGPEATSLGVVAPSWWWGVVFDLWIVVASINGMRCPCVGGVFFCAIFEKLWFLCL